jgi:cytochrome P450 / NADPH-cytochrome P450 reductase
VCDDTKFEKFVSGPLYEVRNMAGPGLFTAFTHEKEWKLAHKLLLPVFGPLGIQKMFPEMLDITSQMLMKWQRLGDGAVIDPVDAFTRLTLDTIALCAFDYRFNSSFTLCFLSPNNFLTTSRLLPERDASIRYFGLGCLAGERTESNTYNA